jgi:hypothetical protein
MRIAVGAQSTYVEVLGVDLAVLGLVEVLFRDEHALLEEVLVDELAVSLGNQPFNITVSIRSLALLLILTYILTVVAGVYWVGMRTGTIVELL